MCIQGFIQEEDKGDFPPITTVATVWATVVMVSTCMMNMYVSLHSWLPLKFCTPQIPSPPLPPPYMETLNETLVFDQ